MGLSVKIWACGVAVTSLAVLPDWSIYNKHPIKWTGFTESVGSKKSEKGGKKKAT